MYDMIVVGARCAGSPTAMLLARRGHNVLLVDRTAFPSDTINGHFIHPPGVARLRKWGLLDRLQERGYVATTRWLFDAGPLTFTGSPPPLDGVAAAAYAPRRYDLDEILVRAAVEAGAELRERFTVDELLFDDDRVTGIRGRTANGRRVSERARIVVGADGMRSLVARAVEAEEYATEPPLTCAYYSYWSGIGVEAAEVHPRERRAVIAFPVTDELSSIFIEWPAADFHEFRSDIERNFLATVDLVPGLAERVRSGTRAERFIGTAMLTNYFRKAHGPGWVLVGDAGYHKDPYLAQGINDAFRDAELLAEAIHDGLSGRRSLDQATADYERRRNEAAMPGYRLNLDFARLEPPPPEMQRLLASLPGNPAATERFWGVLMSVLPVSALGELLTEPASADTAADNAAAPKAPVRTRPAERTS